jgi:hypothetical protein
MISRAIRLLAPVVLLAACTTNEVAPVYTPPTPVAPPPPGAIAGHSAFRLASGQRVSCAGYSVALMPDLPRYRRRIQALYGADTRAMASVPDVKARSAKLPPSPDTAPIASAACDTHGEFSFQGLRAGTYFLIAHVKVKPADAAHNDYVMLQALAVEAGTTTDIVLGP